MLYKQLSLLAVALLLSALVRAQSISVEGEVNTPLKLSSSDIAAMQQITVTATDKDGKAHRYTGVPLYHILQQAGVTLGAQLRGANMTKYLLVKSADGYKVIFALPELDSIFTDRQILLANQVDGQPLPAEKGPFRIVVPGEKKPARWIWGVTAMIIRSAKD
ncbi:MAG: molybdopterin-dependent oxidoreductase [Chitinophaga sp.]|uniref:molybdopterin-dependent oxidoreductase n=1 Tax=Chitinophaga sp. TaxID=1869181 RepID=UPI001B07C1C4|nr:molybdopterin-dependent oxidoreductase [Chitinophaga sp.]MBO9733176.1 molybdopterin-dependent oxidoreductase [Chitinophaga sp.]